MIKVAYWKEKNNFGDILTPVLLKRLFNIESEWGENDDIDFVGIGSVLEAIPPTFSGIIWGSGQMRALSELSFPKAKIIALRGLKTAEKMGIKTVVGDPGILAKMIAPQGIQKTHNTGIIAHWNDPHLKEVYDGYVIDITSGVDNVIAETMACKKIISSSLHGLVLADAFSIPRMWHPSIKNPGGGFKFHDYQSIYPEEIEPGKWFQSDPEVVDDICLELSQALRGAGLK